MNKPDWLQYDTDYIWHPYSSFNASPEVYPVVSAKGCCIKLADGRELIDGMASWWSMIHGYNHPEINAALKEQIDTMSHVMFGGLTHEPAAKLAAKLVEITPQPLQNVFFSDSGSVSVEVAIKMAIQYWHSLGKPSKQKMLTVHGGYHGDTFGAMAVCDPVTGMHQLFNETLVQHYFAERPEPSFNEQVEDKHLISIKESLEKNHENIAAVIIEPIVQGAGGMRFYTPEYLVRLRALCDKYNVLLIFDEIATGFGRTGKLFAAEHARVCPDIMCVGKALTAGYMTLAATFSTKQIAETISSAKLGVFMHGPTFMANPLACRAALTSLELLLRSDWQENIKRIELNLTKGLEPCKDLPSVAEVRILGAIGVVETHEPVDMPRIVPAFVEQGVWVRPFGKLVYVMPPYVIQDEQIEKLTQSIFVALQ